MSVVGRCSRAMNFDKGIFFQCIELMNFKSSTSATFFIYLFTLISCLFIIQFNLVLATEIWSVEELKDGYVTRQKNWV